MKKAIAHKPPELSGDAATRLRTLHGALKAAAANGGHAVPAVIAISKTQPAEAIRPLIAAGQRRFGENKVQEAQAKWPALIAETPDIELHLVGQLQSNKAADAVRLFDAIHSLDRPSLAEALAKAIAREGRTPRLFVQVNIGDEPQKGGVAIADLPALLEHCCALGANDRRPDGRAARRRRPGALFRAAGETRRPPRPARPQHGDERRFRHRNRAWRDACADRHGAVR